MGEERLSSAHFSLRPMETMQSILKEILAHPDFREGKEWRRRLFHPNEVVVREGEAGRSLFLLETGELRVSGRVQLEDSRRVCPGLCDLAPGEVFGELTLFDSAPRTATVTALCEATVVEIDGPALDRFLERHPQLGYRLLRSLYGVLARRLRRADRQLEGLIGWGLRARRIDRFL